MNNPTTMNRTTLRFFVTFLSLLTAGGICALLIALAGRNPLIIFQKMFSATLGSSYGMGQLIFKMTTLLLVGLAVAIPFRLRLFNIGGEGQLLMGAFTAAMTGTMLPESIPPIAAILLCTLAAMAAGACWALLAGVLKVQCGVNEVIGTIMLNFIAQAITGYLLTYHFAIPSTVHTSPIVKAAAIPTLYKVTGWFTNSPANLSTLLAISMALLCWFLLFHSRFGYEMRAAGLQPDAAQYGGINAKSHSLSAMGLGGAAAGLGAANIILGYKHYFEAGATGGIGFTGITVALLAGAHPLWLIPSALFFGFTEYGGLTVNALIPKEIFMIIQALAIILVISFSALEKRFR